MAAIAAISGMSALPQDAAIEEEFAEAARCRVHTEMLPLIFEGNQERVRFGAAVYSYWVEESDRLADAMEYDENQRSIQYLLIPITADAELLDACILKAIEGSEEAQ